MKVSTLEMAPARTWLVVRASRPRLLASPEAPLLLQKHEKEMRWARRAPPRPRLLLTLLLGPFSPPLNLVCPCCRRSASRAVPVCRAPARVAHAASPPRMGCQKGSPLPWGCHHSCRGGAAADAPAPGTAPV